MKLQDALKTDRFRNNRHRAILNMLYTAYWYKSQVSSILKDNGLTLEQFNVLRILKGKNPEAMCVKDIAGRMLEKSSNVPRIIDRLVKKKLVKRKTSKEDKRETLISMTDKGMEQVDTATRAVDKLDHKILSLTDEDAVTLHELLEKLRLTD